jgi:hypothetical protein
MPLKLDVFDFDGTLFHSPLDTPENRQKYERATGLPWLIDKEKSRELSKKHGKFIGMRRGWWGRGETLEPPLVAVPAPLEWFAEKPCADFRASKADPEALTTIMTGRYAKLRPHVLRILDEGGLVNVRRKHSKDGTLFCTVEDIDVQVFCLGEDGPGGSKDKPGDTFPWKVWMIQQFLETHPDITEVRIWEDREEHIVKFKELDLGVQVSMQAIA